MREKDPDGVFETYLHPLLDGCITRPRVVMHLAFEKDEVVPVEGMIPIPPHTEYTSPVRALQPLLVDGQCGGVHVDGADETRPVGIVRFAHLW